MGEGSGLRECRGGSLSPAWRMGRVGGLGGFGKDSPAGGVSDGLGHLTRSKRQRAWTRKLAVPGSKARPPLLCEAVFMSQGTANGRGSEGGAARRLRGQGTPPPFLVPLSDACTGAQGPAPPGPPATGSAGWGGRRGGGCPRSLPSMVPIPESTSRPLHSSPKQRLPSAQRSVQRPRPPPPLLPASLDPSPAGVGEEEPGPGRRRGRRARRAGGGEEEGPAGGEGVGAEGAA